MATDMADMGVKFCTAPDCSKGGNRPALIWSDIEKFNLMKKCMVCGADLLEKVPPKIISATRKKRVIGETEAHTDRECSTTKRPRSMPNSMSIGAEETTPTTPRDHRTMPDSPLPITHSHHDDFETEGRASMPVNNTYVCVTPAAFLTQPAYSQMEAGHARERCLDHMQWCLSCNWSGHNTDACSGNRDNPDILKAELYWERFKRRTEVWDLSHTPEDVLCLMDHLGEHQSYVSDVEDFVKRRDDFLEDLLQDRAFVDGLDPTLSTDETPRSVYERQVIAANNATRKLVLSVVHAVLGVFGTLIVRDRKRNVHERSVQFRTRLAEEVHQHPWQFPIAEVALQSLEDALERAWVEYVVMMDILEASYLSRYCQGRVLSATQRTMLKIPTSYFRMQSSKEVNDEAL